MTITLPDELKEEFEAKAKAAGFRSVANYVVHLVHSDEPDEEEFPLPPDPARTPRSRAELERMLDEGAASGFVVADEAFWASLHRELQEQHAQDPDGKP